MTTFSLHLDQFEGPLDLLVHLIQKREVDPSSIEMQRIMREFLSSFELEGGFDRGSEFILLASQVALLKSRSLLPRQKDSNEDGLNVEDDPKFDIIHHLIDYCRFKDAADQFSQLEVRQSDHYPRGIKDDEGKMPLGLSGVTLGELGGVFQEILKKASISFGQIEEEEFRVQDKILFIRSRIRIEHEFTFYSLFQGIEGKIELIVIFLAVLELIKIGEVKIKKTDTEIVVYGERN